VVAKLNETPWPNPSLDAAPITWRRRIVERCIYGVDINPLAAELAKLSLWLASASVGRPLSFLRHHLKIGNSLLGVRLEDLPILPGSEKREGESLLSLLLTETLHSVLKDYQRIAAADSDEITAVDEKKCWEQQAQRGLTPMQDIANVWLSAFFGNSVSEDAYAHLLSLATQAHSEAAWESMASANRMVREARAIAERERFFHWELRFPDAMVDGQCRFGAVIANPPYVGTSPNAAIVALYDTAKCGDLYAWMFELALRVTPQDGNVGTIVPLSLVFSRALKPLRAMILRRTGTVKLANFDAQMDGIFPPDMGKRNSQRATVVTLQAGPGPLRLEATDMLRWFNQERPLLIPSLRYADITEIASEEAFPKLGNPRLVSFWRAAVAYGNSIGQLLYRPEKNSGNSRDLNWLFVPNTTRYFITAMPFQFKRSEMNAFGFEDSWTRDVAFLALNSNVFYWVWHMLGDGFHVTLSNVCAMVLPKAPSGDAEVARLRDALLGVAPFCATAKVRSGESIPNYNFNKRMDILLEIDDWIVRHVAPDLNLPCDAFAQYKSNSFLRSLDLSTLGVAPEEE
jgi:hypothetical protein